MSEEDKDQETDGKRLLKREAAVGQVKRTPAYILTALYKTPRPLTPDPSGSCSKRAWERSVQRWRAALRSILRQLNAQGCHVSDELYV